MGTDISVYVERRNKEWETVVVPQNLLPEDRNYALWAYLFSDIRANWPEPPLFERRTIPDDSSYYKLSEDEDIADCFICTYAYLDELQNVDWDVRRDGEQPFKECYFKYFVKIVLPRLLDLDLESASQQRLELRNIRILVGFDS